jgi:glycosyltransferase involved in cell wall biosynthesis
MKISIVIASCNENEELARTIKSIEDTNTPDLEIIVVDDASDTEQPHATIVNPFRFGSSMSRYMGCLQATGDVVIIMDAHMRVKNDDILKVSILAKKNQGFVYAGCNNHYGATIKQEGGILRVRWDYDLTLQNTIQQTSGMLGAFYAVPRDVLNRMGGWIKLPGYLGEQELAMSILATKCKVPIFLHTEVNVHHQFRTKEEAPYDMDFTDYVVNIPALYRILFEDSTWESMWRPRLQKFRRLDQGQWIDMSISKNILDSVDTADIVEYGELLKKNMVLNDLDFFLSLFPESSI